MKKDALKALRAQLGDEIPKGVVRLEAEHVHDLADAVKDARHRQAQALAAASERAFSHIPRLLRGPIRRVLG